VTGLGFAEFDPTMPWDHIVFWHWLAFGLVLAAIEIFVPGTFLIWLGLAASLVGLILLIFPEMGVAYQLLLFAIFTVAMVYVGRRVYNRHSEPEDHADLNRRLESHVGKVYTLEQPIVSGKGRIRVADSSWSCAADQDLPAGTKVRVLSIDGIIMHVEQM